MKTAIIMVLLFILGVIGEIRCIYKMVDCNWQSPYKAEVFYTVGTFTGFGCIIGWFNIKD